ncbi:acetylglutamate kinase [Alteribacter populi]|uniref:acetylglutamate kinase n=1 Tax=Alteribacter populi TaxID=2011011 RepID=UPI0018E2880F|nr:acetylglutamate kinase [Alteribacter populi]
MNYLVIKCGGSVLEKLPESFYKNLNDLHHSGKWKPVIVHGGGPLISTLLTELGVKTTFVDGLRVTTKEVLDVVEMVLSGSVNKQLVNRIQKAGGSACGISGVDGALLQAKAMKNADRLGFVGEVTHVNTDFIDQILKQEHIPVISPLGVDEKGQKYNINGDVAASAVAKALSAELCFISDIEGVYRKENGITQTLHHISKTEIEQLIEEKQITGGMIPKVQAGIEGLSGKVEQVVILNGLAENSLIDFLAGKEVGTKIFADGERYSV